MTVAAVKGDAEEDELPRGGTTMCVVAPLLTRARCLIHDFLPDPPVSIASGSKPIHRPSLPSSIAPPAPLAASSSTFLPTASPFSAPRTPTGIADFPSTNAFATALILELTEPLVPFDRARLEAVKDNSDTVESAKRMSTAFEDMPRRRETSEGSAEGAVAAPLRDEVVAGGGKSGVRTRVRDRGVDGACEVI